MDISPKTAQNRVHPHTTKGRYDDSVKKCQKGTREEVKNNEVQAMRKTNGESEICRQQIQIRVPELPSPNRVKYPLGDRGK